MKRSFCKNLEGYLQFSFRLFIYIFIAYIFSAGNLTAQPQDNWQSRSLRTIRSLPDFEEELFSQFGTIPSLRKVSIGPPIFPSFSMAPKTLDDPAFNFSYRYPYWIGDVNGDGRTDIAFVNLTGDDRTPGDIGDTVMKTAVFFGPGGASPSQFLYNRALWTIGDFNNDGFDDAFDFESISVVYGSAAGLEMSLGDQPLNNFNYGDIHPVGDVNGDGKDDFLTPASGEVRFILGGTVDFFDIVPVPDIQNWRTNAVKYLPADFDGDLSNEILVVPSSLYNSGTKSYILKYEQSGNNFSLIDSIDFVYDDQAWLVGISDLNGDTFPDLWYPVFNDINENYDIEVRLGTAAPPYFSPAPALITVGSERRIFHAVGDVNNDGYDDLSGEDVNRDGTLYLGNATVQSGFITQVLDYLPDELVFLNGGSFNLLQGDNDGDGIPDVLFQYNNYDVNDRIEFLGTAILPGGGTISAASTQFITQSYDQSGIFLRYGIETANLGDVNSDGFDDWGIASFDGRYADLFFGGPNPDMDPDVKILLPQKDTNVTYSIEGGDLNGDGISDVIVSLQHSDNALSKIYIYFGRQSWSGTLYGGDADVTLFNPGSIDSFGYFVKIIGDYNADGFNDFLVSGTSYQVSDTLFKREAYLYFGGASISNTPDLVLSAPDLSSSAFFGYRINASGDINGDGYDDFALSDRHHPYGDGRRGRVLVYYGGPGADNMYDLELGSPDIGVVGFGFSLAVNGGDYDGDGENDVAVGAVHDGAIGAGRVYIYSGGEAIDSLFDYTLDLYDIGVFYGSIAYAFEFSQTGRSDLILSTGFGTGTNAYVFRAGQPVSKSQVDFVLEAPNPNADLGGAYKFAVGNFNGDNKLDLVLAQISDLNLGTSGVSGGFGAGMAYYYESPLRVYSLDIIDNDISIPDTFGAFVDTISVPVYVGKDISAQDIFAMQFSVGYDPEVLRFVGLDENGIFISNYSVDHNVVNGQVNVAVAATAPFAGSGKLIGLKMMPMLGATVGSTSSLSLLNFAFNEGYVSFSNFFDGSFTVNAYFGDVNSNNTINSTDGAEILRFVVEKTPLTSFSEAKADVTGNGEVTAFDASYVLRYAVSLLTIFPVEELIFNNLFPKPTVEQNAVITVSQFHEEDNVVVYTLKNTDNIDVYSLYIDMKTGNLEYIGFEIPAGEVEPLAAFQNNEDEFILALAGAHPAQKDGEIIKLKFRKTGVIDDNVFSKIILNETNVSEIKWEKVVSADLPVEYKLFDNYPNPFNGETVIRYQLPRDNVVYLKLYNSLGQEVRTLIEKDMPAGYHSVVWDGRDNYGRPVASATYIYRLWTKDFTATKKLIYIK